MWGKWNRSRLKTDRIILPVRWFLRRLRDWQWRIDRPYKLLAVTGVVIFCAVLLERWFMAEDLRWFRQWIKGSKIFGELLFPDTGSIEWKDRLQGVLLLLGLPIAFCLWHWRDKNVREQIENARKDINLKEFQEVFKIASGGVEANSSNESVNTMQIAALHQLRGFLRGEYGESFRRPAFELLLAGHGQAVRRIGLINQIQTILKDKGDKKLKIRSCIESSKNLLTDVDNARISILREELRFIFLSGFPLSGRNFDLLQIGTKFDGFDENLIFDSVDFSQSSFIGTSFDCISAIGCNFERCELFGADLSFSDLRESRFWDAKMSGAELFETDIRGANFATVDPSELASCYNTYFDDDTWLRPAWGSIDSGLRQAAQRAWLERDALFDSEVLDHEDLTNTRVTPGYHINVFWYPDDNIWIADVPDLKPCSAHGATPSEAVAEAEVAIDLWLETAKEHGMPIPEPRYRPAIYAAA